jgi:hypothetical protein
MKINGKVYFPTNHGFLLHHEFIHHEDYLEEDDEDDFEEEDEEEEYDSWRAFIHKVDEKEEEEKKIKNWTVLSILFLWT